jgi:hypothetical protein
MNNDWSGDHAFNLIKLQTMQNVTSDWIDEHAFELLKFAAITEEDVRNIFIKTDERPLRAIEFDTLVYSFDAPLFHKMIFRLRQGKGCPSQLYTGCDGGNKSKLLRYFGMRDRAFNKDMCDCGAGQLVGFFAWIRNSFGGHDIVALEGTGTDADVAAAAAAAAAAVNMKTSAMLQAWGANNSVDFYFTLCAADQAKFIKKYNDEVVVAHNKIFDALL